MWSFVRPHSQIHLKLNKETKILGNGLQLQLQRRKSSVYYREAVAAADI